MIWDFPLKGDIILPDDKGSYGYVRENHTHEGIDLYGDQGQDVYAVEDGVVVSVERFTGGHCEKPSPWWNNTWAVLIEGVTGVVCYGEITSLLTVGQKVYRGDKVGEIETVLKKSKGRPISMLHLELYDHGIRSAGEWVETKPKGLKDPTPYIVEAFNNEYQGLNVNKYYSEERYVCYQLISEYYDDRVAKRSQVRLMNHIDEGLAILDRLGCSQITKNAFCIHPLLQPDIELSEYYNDKFYKLKHVNPKVLLLAMEYRNVANKYLSKHCMSCDDVIELSPIKEVNQMLIADKIQNYKDFILYHKSTHEKSEILTMYFENWLKVLGCRKLFQEIV